jgi:hypothetical protein
VFVSCFELRWMNRSDHWQNLAWLGELLLTPGSTNADNSVSLPSNKAAGKNCVPAYTFGYLRHKPFNKVSLRAKNPL